MDLVSSYDEEGAKIKAVEVTDEIRSAIELLNHNCRTIPVTDGTDTIMCRTDTIYYCESVDKHTYVYTKDGCFETKYRLYELEELLNLNYFRCAKALIVNIRKIRSVKSELNGRMVAEMLNGEKIIISRAYVKDLKKRLGVN